MERENPGLKHWNLNWRCEMKAQQWPQYIPQSIEPKWQRLWEQQDLYLATETGDKPKYYCMDFFPYPSGDGLHVGHCRNYIPTDVMSRYKRMKGYNVLHPMGATMCCTRWAGMHSENRLNNTLFSMEFTLAKQPILIRQTSAAR